ncbi:hypothetical protein BJV74DRAFT_74019 [Russula compacta]|nr:hypothetical protein BJV74DRAFT_74019 [Russula compacta]
MDVAVARCVEAWKVCDGCQKPSGCQPNTSKAWESKHKVCVTVWFDFGGPRFPNRAIRTGPKGSENNNEGDRALDTQERVSETTWLATMHAYWPYSATRIFCHCCPPTSPSTRSTSACSRLSTIRRAPRASDSTTRAAGSESSTPLSSRGTGALSANMPAYR